MDSHTFQSGGDGSQPNPWGLGDDPPRLANYDPTPRYELSRVVQLLGVRRATLLSWEQHLGMPANARLQDGQDSVYRYSERDLVAMWWIRDRVVAGLPVSEAIARLISRQDTYGPATSGTDGTAPYRPPINTQPLRHSTFGAQPNGERGSAPLPPQGSAPLPPRGSAPLPPRASAPLPPRGSAPLALGEPKQARRMTGLPQSGPDVFIGLPSGPLTFSDLPETTRIRRASGPAGADLRALAQPLLRAFGALDTASANEVISEALAASSMEAVCVGLLQPVLNRIGDLWKHNQMTMPEERFALNYIRAFLFSHFHVAMERPDAPMVFIGCGPREYYDLNALMLAAFWRHAGLRVIYLGQNVDGQNLVQEARARRPALIALCIDSPRRVRLLSQIGRELEQIPAPRPIFAYGGQIFARNPELQRKVTGVYLGDDATTATWHVRRLLGMGRSSDEVERGR